MSYYKNHIRQLVLVTLSCLGWSFVSANDEPSDDQPVTDPPAATSHPTPIGPISNGFVFDHGQYVLLPYFVRQSDSVVSIVGDDHETEVSASSETGDTDTRTAKRTKGGSKAKRRPPNQAGWRSARRVADELAGGLTEVFLEGRPPVLLRRHESAEFMAWLLDKNRQPLASDPRPSWLPANEDVKQWNQFFAAFEVQDEFALRARTHITDVAATLSVAEQEIGAQQLLHRSVYPLSVGGLLLIAMATGQLLGSHKEMTTEVGVEESEVINAAIGRCLWLIVGFAALDLIWTILAARAGEMRELNPFGSRFIQDPWLLTAAKVVCTALAVGILHGLRSHVAARRAAWWMCLVSALVAVRWVFLSGVLV